MALGGRSRRVILRSRGDEIAQTRLLPPFLPARQGRGGQVVVSVVLEWGLWGVFRTPRVLQQWQPKSRETPPITQKGTLKPLCRGTETPHRAVSWHGRRRAPGCKRHTQWSKPTSTFLFSHGRCDWSALD